MLPPASAVPLAGAGSGSLDAAQAAMFPHYYSNLAGAGVSGALGSGGSAPAVYGASPLSLQDQQLLAGGGGGGAISLPAHAARRRLRCGAAAAATAGGGGGSAGAQGAQAADLQAA